MALLCGGVDHNALHFLFDFKVAKSLYAERVALIEIIGYCKRKRSCQRLCFLRVELGSSGNLGEKFFAVHDVTANSNFEVGCAEN